MQLKTARLCLDCEEIHEDDRCPVCASETFAYLTRWIPRPDTPTERPSKPEPSPEATVYRRLLVAEATRPKAARLLRQGAVGLAAFSLARWAWRRHRRDRADS